MFCVFCLEYILVQNAERMREMEEPASKYGPVELLTVEEFAERMKISRTTVFDWIRKGTLKIGQHYIKIGRVVRFEWGPELIQKLREIGAEVQDEQKSKALPRQAGLRRKGQIKNRRVAIDLDY